VDLESGSGEWRGSGSHNNTVIGFIANLTLRVKYL